MMGIPVERLQNMINNLPDPERYLGNEYKFPVLSEQQLITYDSNPPIITKQKYIVFKKKLSHYGYIWEVDITCQ
jgi:CYTH domain-containing protein